MQSDFDIQLYCDNYVTLDQKEKKLVKQKITPLMRTLITNVSTSSRGVFAAKTIAIGSSNCGLKSSRTNEFDYNVPLGGIGPLHWGTGGDSSIDYGFAEITDMEKAKTTSQQGLTIIRTGRRVSPEVGYTRLPFPSDGPKQKYSELIFNGDLVPYLVKMKYKQLLIPECDRQRSVTLCQTIHGPALTITVERDSARLPYDVSIDLAPTVEAQLSYPDNWGWPRPGGEWPSSQLIRRTMDKGVNLVGKQNFFWKFSFSLMEKELCRSVDAPGECRKKVHRIMKLLLKNQWKFGSSLSSFELKNAWLLCCEEIPDNWGEVNIRRRFIDCTLHFRDCLVNHSLQQYFYRARNMLEGKPVDELRITAQRIDDFLSQHRIV